MAAGEAICCICSRSKNHDPHPLPAVERYTGTHIKHVKTLAENQKNPFFVLSGVHGFIPGRSMIWNYDHLLQPNEVAALAHKIGQQLKYYGIKTLHFYTKDKPNWQPYLAALKQGAEVAGVQLHVNYLEDDT